MTLEELEISYPPAKTLLDPDYGSRRLQAHRDYILSQLPDSIHDIVSGVPVRVVNFDGYLLYVYSKKEIIVHPKWALCVNNELLVFALGHEYWHALSDNSDIGPFIERQRELITTLMREEECKAKVLEEMRPFYTAGSSYGYTDRLLLDGICDKRTINEMLANSLGTIVSGMTERSCQKLVVSIRTEFQ